MTEHDRDAILAIKDNQIADLQNQLERAELREDALTAEKSKLLELVSRMQEQNEILTLPGEVEKKPNWVVRLLGYVLKSTGSLVRLSITLSCNQTRFSHRTHSSVDTAQVVVMLRDGTNSPFAVDLSCHAHRQRLLQHRFSTPQRRLSTHGHHA